MLEGRWLTTYLQGRLTRSGSANQGMFVHCPPAALAPPGRRATPYQQQHCRAREENRKSVHIALLSAPTCCKYHNRAAPNSSQRPPLFKVCKYSLQHHKPLARCFKCKQQKGQFWTFPTCGCPALFFTMSWVPSKQSGDTRSTRHAGKSLFQPIAHTLAVDWYCVWTCFQATLDVLIYMTYMFLYDSYSV